MPPPEPTESGPPTRTAIQSIDRAAIMLEKIAEVGPAGISPTALAQAVGLAASTSRSLLNSLLAHGFIAQLPNRRYVLGTRFHELNRIYTTQADLAAVAGPILRDLWEATRETVHLSVLRNDRRVDLSVLVSPQLLNVNPSSGGGSARHPEASLFQTAAGKVLLAGLADEDLSRLRRRARTQRRTDTRASANLIAEVRAQGYATNRDEDVVGVCGVAAPVLDSNGQLCASLCIGYPSVRRTAGYEENLRSAVMEAADRLSRMLGAER